MKGLLIKDMRLTMKNYRMLIMFLCLAAFFVFSSTGVEFAIAYIMMFLGMSVMTTISFDEVDHSNAFLMTLPVTRKIYVREKYVFAGVCILIGLVIGDVFGLLAQFIRPSGDFSLEFMIGSLATFIIYWNLVAIMIPIQLKFGGDNGRLVTIAIAAVLAAAIIGSMKLVELLSIDTQGIVNQLMIKVKETNGMILIIPIAIITIIVTASTMAIALKIMKKKQF